MIFALIVLALASAGPAQADNGQLYDDAKVANFGIASQANGDPVLEKLSFWSGPRGHTVEYSYGTDGKRVRLRALGRNADDRSFAVRFPNGLVLDVAPGKDALLVSDRAGKYRKRFVWLYEGPKDGRGTFCAVCVPQLLALSFVRENFMQSDLTEEDSRP